MDQTDNVVAQLVLRTRPVSAPRSSDRAANLRHPVPVHAGPGTSVSPSSVAGTLKPEQPREPPAALFVQLMAS